MTQHRNKQWEFPVGEHIGFFEDSYSGADQRMEPAPKETPQRRYAARPSWKKELLTKTEKPLDPLQFAYRGKWGTEDATAFLLNMYFKHLKDSKVHSMILLAE